MIASSSRSVASALAWLAVAAACLAVASACSESAVLRGAEAAPVRVAEAVERTVPVEIHAIGNVEPITTVSVKPQIEGIIASVMAMMLAMVAVLTLPSAGPAPGARSASGSRR